MLSMMVKRPKESDMPLGQQMEGRTTSSGLDSPVKTKVAIVTGASRGIGRGIAERLLETGYCVVANSRNITSAKTLQPGDRLKLVGGDIASHNVAKQLVDSAIGNFGRIDLLVNNAGVFIPKPFTEYTTEDFCKATETNLCGFFMFRNLQHHRCAFRSPGISSTSHRR